jgi:hypothetical protein
VHYHCAQYPRYLGHVLQAFNSTLNSTSHSPSNATLLAPLEQLALVQLLDEPERTVKLAEFAEIKRLNFAGDLKVFPRQAFLVADTLEVLDLSNNHLSTLPEDFGRFTALKVLFLSNNCFTELPKVLADCPNLTMIGFKSNQISNVPEDALPKQTRWLILTDNKITQLPKSMGQLTQLQKCALAGNFIEQLPATMANCTALELLRISANRLISIPQWLFTLPKLSWLAIDGNPAVQGQPDETLNSATVAQASLAQLSLGEELGQGASGVILKADWHATNSGTSQTVAVKLFKGAVTSDGYPKDELACSLKVGLHDNITQVLGHIDENDTLGLVMGLIPNSFINLGLPPTLITCTRDTFESDVRFTEVQILKVAKQIAHAMTHLHEKAISHGDLYAHNILIDSSDNVVFGDFGAATNLGALSIVQKMAMERIEVRAFGCLLDDLLSLCSGASEVFEDLSRLRMLCMQSDCAARPKFSSLLAHLDKV